MRDELSALRHDILHVRRTLSPTRDAVRRVFDDRVDVRVGEVELFDRATELHFADAYEKLMRASEALDLSRDLVSGVRDYYQAKVANDQNEVMKRLTIVASLLLPASRVGESVRRTCRMSCRSADSSSRTRPPSQSST